MLSVSGPVCQSCGIPLSLDERGGGTEADGQRNHDYCSHCYARGAFTHPIMTMPQMLQQAATRMREMRVPESTIARLTGALPNLGRWKQRKPS